MRLVSISIRPLYNSTIAEIILHPGWEGISEEEQEDICRLLANHLKQQGIAALVDLDPPQIKVLV
jgi:hypothetical protein